jgi:hypothetical protein
MKTLTVVAALALGAALSQQAAACDWQKEAEAKPIIIMSCGIVSGCVLEQPTDEALIFADSGCSNCAVEEPDALVLPQTLEDNAVEQPMDEPVIMQELQPAPQRADGAKPIVLAARCPSGKRVMGRCVQ